MPKGAPCGEGVELGGRGRFQLGGTRVRMRQAAQPIHDEHDDRSTTFAVDSEVMGERDVRHDFVLRNLVKNPSFRGKHSGTLKPIRCFRINFQTRIRIAQAGRICR